jgi:predicted RNase H-like HicB family nuclease
VKDYQIIIFYSDEDKCYIADIPDLKYCSAFGSTPEEALKEILIAKEGWLELARDSGKPVPPAKFRAGRLGPDPKPRVKSRS